MCSQVKSICTYLSTGTMLQGAALDDIIFQLRLEMTLPECVSSIAFVFAYVSVNCVTMQAWVDKQDVKRRLVVQGIWRFLLVQEENIIRRSSLWRKDISTVLECRY